VTIAKDNNRGSKGIAFILFINKDAAKEACTAMDGQQLNGRTIKVSIAKDNGRTKEFIKKKVYKDKSKCYECGESGHLSYACSKNSLGERKKPKKEKKKKRKKEDEDAAYYDSDNDPGPLRYKKIMRYDDEYDDEDDVTYTTHTIKREKPYGKESRKKAGYFSDEDAESE